MTQSILKYARITQNSNQGTGVGSVEVYLANLNEVKVQLDPSGSKPVLRQSFYWRYTKYEVPILKIHNMTRFLAARPALPPDT